MKLQPNPEQLKRLQEFAAENGPQWKSKLSDLWMNGRDDRERDGHLLRQVRNNFGPSWLVKFKLPK